LNALSYGERTGAPVFTKFVSMATREYDLSYGDLKEISKNSLRYGFLQDDAKRAAMDAMNAEFRAFERKYR